MVGLASLGPPYKLGPSYKLGPPWYGLALPGFSDGAKHGIQDYSKEDRRCYV